MPQFQSFEDFVLFMEDYNVPSQTQSTISLDYSQNRKVLGKPFAKRLNKNISLNDISNQCHIEKS